MEHVKYTLEDHERKLVMLLKNQKILSENQQDQGKQLDVEIVYLQKQLDEMNVVVLALVGKKKKKQEKKKKAGKKEKKEKREDSSSVEEYEFPRAGATFTGGCKE